LRFYQSVTVSVTMTVSIITTVTMTMTMTGTVKKLALQLIDYWNFGYIPAYFFAIIEFALSDIV